MDVEEDKVKRRVVAADEPLQTWSVVDNPLVQRVAYVSKHNCNADINKGMRCKKYIRTTPLKSVCVPQSSVPTASSNELYV